MVVEWIVQVGAGFAGWLATLFPVLDLPPQLINADEAFTVVMGYGEGLGAFVDWTWAGIILTIGLGVWVASLVVKAARAAIGHVPFVGGKG